VSPLPIGRSLVVDYLGHELRQRWSQSLPTGAGMAVGVSVVITASATAAGAGAAESRVLQSLGRAAASGPAASQVGSAVAATSGIAADLGLWVSVAALTASFAIAALVALASVNRRVHEFGTLKALGWSVRRITLQALTETATVGIAGTVAGIGLGCAAAAVISAFGPTLSISAPQFADPTGSASGGGHDGPLPVPYSALVSPGIVVVAAGLGIIGALLAGALGAWQAARLRPAEALARAD
jgi:putative ABC transport system permease protein